MKKTFIALFPIVILFFSNFLANAQSFMQLNVKQQTEQYLPECQMSNFELHEQNRKRNAKKNKSTMSSKHVLDSLIHFGNSGSKTKITFSYDTIGNNTEYVFYRWDDDTEQLIKTSKIEYVYDSNGNNILIIKYVWNTVINDWKNLTKYEYNYDVNRNKILWIYYEWRTGQWVNYGKYEYDYDVNGNITLSIHYYWSASVSQWLVNAKYEYDYDANGNNTSITRSAWNPDVNQWFNSFKEVNNYEVNGNLSSYVSYNWNGQNWLNYSKDEFSYDSNGNLVSIFSYLTGSSQLLNTYKKEYTYDINGNNTLSKYYTWDPSLEQWNQPDIYEFNYNLFHSLDDLILPNEKFTESISIVNKPMNYVVNYPGGTYDVLFYYSERNFSSIDEMKTDQYKLFPNPVLESLCINLERNKEAIFELFDMQGRKLINKAISGIENINIENLQSGIYIYNLYLDNEKYVGKLFKK